LLINFQPDDDAVKWDKNNLYQINTYFNYYICDIRFLLSDTYEIFLAAFILAKFVVFTGFLPSC